MRKSTLLVCLRGLLDLEAYRLCNVKVALALGKYSRTISYADSMQTEYQTHVSSLFCCCLIICTCSLMWGMNHHIQSGWACEVNGASGLREYTSQSWWDGNIIERLCVRAWEWGGRVQLCVLGSSRSLAQVVLAKHADVLWDEVGRRILSGLLSVVLMESGNSDIPCSTVDTVCVVL
jgi:hypothetical protein